MTGTTDVVHKPFVWDTCRRHGYFFREAAMLTITMGVCLHLYRVIFGDDLTMRYVVTPTTDKILLVPMTYAAFTGILLLGALHRLGGLHRGQRAAAHLLLVHHLGHDADDLVPDVVQLLPADPGVPGLPDHVLAPAI
jgi:hypothetical protein